MGIAQQFPADRDEVGRAGHDDLIRHARVGDQADRHRHDPAVAADLGLQHQSVYVTASDGIEGLSKLETIKPDLIILDLNMPRMGGVEFYQKISVDNMRPLYPVLVLTARANTEQLFKDLEVDGFMVKPFEVDDLIKEAGIIIQKRGRAVEATRKETKQVLHSVYLAESDPDEMNRIALVLLNAGYKVACAKSGAAAIELLSIDPPSLGLVRLGLSDIAGDVVVQRALRMAKTSGIKFLLYQKRDIQHLGAVRRQIGNKTGVIELVEYDSPVDLLHYVDETIRKGSVEKEGGTAE